MAIRIIFQKLTLSSIYGFQIFHISNLLRSHISHSNPHTRKLKHGRIMYNAHNDSFIEIVRTRANARVDTYSINANATKTCIDITKNVLIICSYTCHFFCLPFNKNLLAIN